LIYVEEDLRGEGVAILLRKPSPEGGGSWHGAIVVRGCRWSETSRGQSNQSSQRRGRQIRVSGLNTADDEDGITQEVSITGVGAPPF
jgi:hypothetical protein